MRIPLHIKLMVSYLLVVGLVFLPTVIYLSTTQRNDLRSWFLHELEAEAHLVGERLSQTPDAQLAPTIELIISLLSQRVTVLDPRGRVLSDTFRETSGNHADRPEVIAALANESGIGTAERKSETTGRSLLYVAARYPKTGPVRGVVRLAVPTDSIDERGSRGTIFLNRSGAVALSVAVLLSLVAALVVSRPLRRIAQSARAFAAGDFAHPVGVSSNDELGEAARALEELGAQLRNRLLSAGADRASLHGLVDELPVGVVLYDSRLEPVLVNGPARELCGFDPAHEVERARELPQLPGHADAIRRLLESGDNAELALEPPWGNPPSVRAQWVVIHGADGQRQPALIATSLAREVRLSILVNALRMASERLADGSKALGQSPLAARLRRAADETDALLPRGPARPSDLETLALGQLCDTVLGDLEPVRKNDIELSLDDDLVAVVDAGGRTRRALRDFLRAALEHVPVGEPLPVTSKPAGGHVRLMVRTPGVPNGLNKVADGLRSLGGEAGWERDGDATEAWLLVPRA